MRRRYLAIGLAALVFVALLWWLMSDDCCFDYPVNPDEPYGPFWKAHRPPGLPDSARLASEPGAGAPHVERIARELGLGEGFAAAAVRLARNESGATLALPARTFDVVDAAARDDDISAWGIFQYNAAAWRSVSGSTEKPWEADQDSEIRLPLTVHYGRVWRHAKSAGASDYYAERAMRLYQIAPGLVAGLIRDAQLRGWPLAWSSVDYVTRNGHDARELVESHLRNA